MRDDLIRPLVILISSDAEIAVDVVLQPYVNIWGRVRIGQATKIGAYAELGDGVVVGARCKIGAKAFLPPGVTLGDEVFIGPGVIFTNDKHPKAVGDWTCLPTRVDSGASIGAGSVILPGLTIGAGAIIGAGSVVTHDVPPGETWAGPPARPR